MKKKGLDIISNDTLRIKIISMYDQGYETVRKFEQNTFLPDHYILTVHATRFDKTEIYVAKGGRNFVGGKMVPYDYETLKSDRTYLHVVKSLVSKNEFFIGYMVRPLRDDVIKLKEAVKAERDRLKDKYD